MKALRTASRLWFFLLIATFTAITSGTAEELPSFLDDRPPPPFEQLRRHYLNLQAKPFVQDLILRERFLVSLIDQIALELDARGPEAWSRSRIGFDLVYRRADSLAREYSAELDRLLRTAATLDTLERAALAKDRYDLVWGIRDLKARITAAIDNSDLEIDQEQKRLLLLRRVDYELSRLVQIYRELEQLRKEATARGRYDLVAQIDACQERVLEVVSTWGKTEPVDKEVLDEYIYELSKLVEILRRLDALAEHAYGHSERLQQMIQEAKARILAELSPEVLEAFGYAGFSRGDVVSLSQLLEEWEKSEWVDYELARTFYEIIYAKLVESATKAERERMLKRALQDGVDTYTRGEFSLAELHFSHAIQSFEGYGFDLTPARFYRSECLYALGHLQESLHEYEAIAADPQAPPQYIALAALRIMGLAHLGQPADFDHAYRLFCAKEEALERDDRAAGHFLAGLWFVQHERPYEASKALDLVPDNTALTLQARFLRGVALAQSDNLDGAKKVFLQLAELRDKPGRGYSEALLGNAALVKLGLIAYEQGDLRAATEYLERVSPDFPDYDEALLGTAWAYLKQGDYRSPIPAAEEVFQKFVQSEYTYEALVLAAHCKRIIGQPEDALEHLRYVTNARAVEDMAREWGKERLRLARVQAALDSVERVIVERGDAHLYPQLLEAREQVEFALWLLENPGPAGARLLQQFNSERSRIASLLKRSDRLREAALQLGRKDLVYRIDRLQHRLIRTVETYHGDFAIRHVNPFIDYPLALRESTSRYVATLIDSMQRESAREALALRRVRAQLDSLRKAAQLVGRVDLALEAEFWSRRLRRASRDLGWTQGWLASRDVEVIDADFNRWADFSGFGMSDITLALLRDREQKMSRYSEFIQAIDRILEQRKSELERALATLGERIQNLEYELQQLRLAEARKKQDQYFRTQYFDRSTSEEPNTNGLQQPTDGSETKGTGEDATKTE